MLFLIDLNDFLSCSSSGLEHVTNLVHQTLDTNEVEVFMRLYILLYADDAVLLAESAEELQAALNAMFLNCKTWNLSINPIFNGVSVGLMLLYFCCFQYIHCMAVFISSFSRL